MKFVKETFECCDGNALFPYMESNFNGVPETLCLAVNLGLESTPRSNKFAIFKSEAKGIDQVRNGPLTGNQARHPS